MSSHLTFLSVFVPPNSSGNINFTFKTLDAVPNIAIASTPIAVTNTTSESAAAETIQSGLMSLFIANNVLYAGLPTVSTVDKIAAFSVTRSEHVIAIWSQAAFEMTVDPTTTGAVIIASPTPLFCTLADANAMNGVFCDVTTVNDQTPTSTQWQTLIAHASEEVKRVSNNNIVLSTYLHEEVFYSTLNSIIFKVRPVVDYDNPFIHKPWMYGKTLLAFGYVKQDYRLTPLGELTTPTFTSSCIDRHSPFRQGSAYSGTYRAGYQQIPPVVKRATMKMAECLTVDPTVAELKAADFSVKFNTANVAYLYAMKLLEGFRL